MARKHKQKAPKPLPLDPLWYKDAVIYQVHIRAFHDSDGDGIGDFRGLLQKLDYLSSLGVNAIWILPFYASPMKDDGYDISDYMRINPMYGTLDDFQAFMQGAHDRGIRVITELVINHTSIQHEWFQLSRRAAPGTYWRDFYVWSDEPRQYKDARIIFRDFEPSNWTYDPIAKSYYWHRFYSHQPDLNFDNPEVKKQIFKVLDYWMGMHVDGMRLDAVPYLYEREGTSCENLPETHAFLKELRAHVDRHFPGRMLLAEVNQWPDDAAAYFGEGDECHMCFHFPIMPRLFMALKTEDRFSILDILRQTPDIPANCQWAMFLRNHDELTLEMVTDEERDYMYNVYATDLRARVNLGIRRRLAPLLENDRRQVELLHGLLFSLPGTPVMYYGDEIGMGDNIYLGDRDGVRTPFQWNADRNAGFSKADPQRLFLPVIATPEYHYTSVNAETQEGNANSLLRWMRSLIDMRKNNPALTRGEIRFLEPENTKVLVFVRDWTDSTSGGDANSDKTQQVLVLANLSKTAQYVELDLAAYAGCVPVELRGETAFPEIGKAPYVVTLAPYGFYWFDLLPKERLNSARWLGRDSSRLAHMPRLREILDDAGAERHMEELLRAYLPRARWFAAKNQGIRRVIIRDILEIAPEPPREKSGIVIAEVYYRGPRDRPDIYLLTLSHAEGEEAEAVKRDTPDLVIGEYDLESGVKGVYYEAFPEKNFAKALLQTTLNHHEVRGRYGLLSGTTYKSVPPKQRETLPDPAAGGGDQSNSSVSFGTKFQLKLFRHLEQGENPEVEIGRHFGKVGDAPVPPLLGSLSYVLNGKVYSAAVVHELVAGAGTAWALFKGHVEAFARAAESQDEAPATALLDAHKPFYAFEEKDLPGWFTAATAEAGHLMRLLGKRTAEMHRLLARAGEDAAFTPEALSPFYQRSLYQSLRNRALRARDMLKAAPEKMEDGAARLRDDLLSRWNEVEAQFGILRKINVGGQRIRIHGDYHLGQVLFANGDFRIIDFEGEPLRSISSRRLRHSPLLDAAGLLRSLDYEVALYCRTADCPGPRPWLRLWQMWMSAHFMAGYTEAMRDSGLLPEDPRHVHYLTETYMLDKALYEFTYELASRPELAGIPLRGILELLPTLGGGKL